MTHADPLMINEHASQATCSTDLLDEVPGIEGFVNTSRLSKRFVLLRLRARLNDYRKKLGIITPNHMFMKGKRIMDATVMR